MVRITVAAIVFTLSLVTAGMAVSVEGTRAVQSPGVEVPGGTTVLARRPPDYRLMLQSRRFVPEPGLPRALPVPADAGEVTHMIVQFRRLPDASDIELLRSYGITLLDYLPNLAYFASVPYGALGHLAVLSSVRSVIAIRPEDRIAPWIREGGVGSYARDEDGTVRVVVVFFGDVDIENAKATAEKYGRISWIRDRDHTLEMDISGELIQVLACEDGVQWIEPSPPPRQELLDDVRATVNADSVQAAPYDLNGSGVALGMWDSGSPAVTHEDFAGRLTIPDGAATGLHATTVGGIMAGDGSRSEGWGGTPYQWRGISTAAEIIAYEWPQTLAELRSETSEAIGTYGIISSSNSWGWYVCGSFCSYFGTYDDWSKVYDNIVRGSRGAPLNVVCGAGNDQDCMECQDSLPAFPYGTVSGPMATAKNTIAVGATNALDRTMTTLSSWGPAKDGRVKPDIVAPGCKPAAGVYGPVPPNDYDDCGCGTSYATPVVSGSIGILRQQFDLLGYGFVDPHTFKAVLIQSAQDLGNPGPDYAFGHGHLELKRAVDLVIANHPRGELIRVDSLLDTEVDVYHMDVESGAGSFRVTLVWDDYKGTPGAAKALINDLDLLVQSPGGAWYYAYKLDPVNPAVPAGVGYNDLDNVEVIEVAAPEPGRWTIRVEGALVPEGPQDYTLVLPFEYPSADVGGREVPPSEFALAAAGPNPFSETTSIRFALPEATGVSLRIYDARGRRVRILLDGTAEPAGRHTACWDGTDETGRRVAPGIYFCRIETGGRAATQRMVLVR